MSTIVVIKLSVTSRKYFLVFNSYIYLFAQQKKYSTVMSLSFRTDMPGQTMQTQIRLLLEGQSDANSADPDQTAPRGAD